MNKVKQYLMDEKGKRTAVVIPIADYEALLEDLSDLTVIAERKKEATVSLNALKKRLKADGLL